MKRNKQYLKALSGRIKWPIDAGGSRTLKARILSSPIGCGRLVNITLPPVDSNIVYVLQRDIPGKNFLVLEGTSIPILSGEIILWRGQPILAAAGKTAAAVEEWLSRVKLEIEELPFETRSTTFIRQQDNSDSSHVKIDHITEKSFTIPVQEKTARPQGIVCLRDGQSISIHVETQWPSLIRQSVARTLKVQEESIEIKSYNMESDTHQTQALWQNALFSTLAALLALKSKKSVRLIIPATDPALNTCQTGLSIQFQTAMDKQMKMLSLSGKISLNSGILIPLEQELVKRILNGIFSRFSGIAYKVEVKLNRMNLPPAMLGPTGGYDIGLTAGEILASRLIENDIQSESIVGTVSGKRLMTKLMAESDYKRKFSAFSQAIVNRGKIYHPVDLKRGIGFTYAGFANGFPNSSKNLTAASLSVTLQKNSKLVVNLPTEASVSIHDAWTAMGRELLNMASDNINYVSNYHVRSSGPSLFGRHVGIYTRLFELACQELSNSRLTPLPLTVERIKRAWKSVSTGAGIVEVFLNPGTLAIENIKIWLNIDGGRLLDAERAHAAVEAAGEEALRWSTGATIRNNIPKFNIQFVNNDQKQLSKDVSSLPWLLIPAALIKALSQASGKEINTLPVYPGLIR